jgi:aerobic-type carbon monoxide dehydrogenase small subunit (CoxS/CutS family)
LRLPVRLNGANVMLEARADEALLTALRRHGLRSVRSSCEIGVCGACTVLLDGQAVSSCLLLAPMARGRDVLTMEGVGSGDPVAGAFMEHAAYQCGYCSPGFILTIKALLAENPSPTQAELKEALGGNLCRCGSYVRILRAATAAIAASA